jgi:hypothetical protein
MPSSMCEDEVCVLVFKPNISQSGAAFNPTSDHQQNPLQPGKVELFKEQSHYLRGTIAGTLQQETPRFAEADAHVLKFHGI